MNIPIEYVCELLLSVSCRLNEVIDLRKTWVIISPLVVDQIYKGQLIVLDNVTTIKGVWIVNWLIGWRPPNGSAKSCWIPPLSLCVPNSNGKEKAPGNNY